MKIISLLLLIYVNYASAQNVGIGNPSPAEKLDVNGNINVTGTIKANGVDGTANQVLMKNNNGTLAWGDLCEYKNYSVFQFTTVGAVQTFSVPAGVTKIKVQVWAGGGTGTGVGGSLNMGAGGGGGGYIEGYFTVTPSTNVNVRVGNGAGAGSPNAGNSQVDYNAILLAAFPGGNATYDAGLTRITPGAGGTFFGTGITSFIGLQGQPGSATILRYDQISATEFGRSTIGGSGGHAGNTCCTGGSSSYFYYNITSAIVLSQTLGTNGQIPGGGASADAIGNAGGHGRVIIYY